MAALKMPGIKCCACTLTLLVGYLGYPGEVLAQGFSGSLLSPDVELQGGPRLWYFFSTGGPLKQPLNLAVTPPTGTVRTLGEFSYVMAGATVSARFVTLPETTFLLSGLYGTSSQTGRTVNVNFPNTNLNSESNNVSRTDIELLAQTTFPDTTAGWIAGIRLEQEDVRFHRTTTPLIPAGPTTLTSSSLSTYIPSIKIGLAAATALTSSGDLRMFGNAMITGGAFVESKRGVITGQLGPDISVGIQYAFSPAVVLDARYRTLVNFFTENQIRGDRYAINHGPMMGLTVKF